MAAAALLSPWTKQPRPEAAPVVASPGEFLIDSKARTYAGTAEPFGARFPGP